MSSLLRTLLLLSFTPGLAAQGLSFTPPFTNADVPQVPLCLHEDGFGFLWIGTTDGLYRYDGCEVREFRKSPTDTNSLVDNFVRKITAGENGTLWLSTNDGICSFHLRTENFRHYHGLLPAGAKVNHITVDRRGELWVSTRKGLLHYDPQTGRDTTYLPQADAPDASLLHELVWSTHEDQRGRIWVAGHLGLTLIERPLPDSLRFRTFPGRGVDVLPGQLATDRVFNFAEVPAGTIWAGTHDGLFRVVERGDSLYFVDYRTTARDSSRRTSRDFISSLHPEGEHRLWVGNYPNGLQEFYFPHGPERGVNITSHRPDPKRSGSLPAFEIKDIQTDRRGLLWTATAKRVEKGQRGGPKFKLIPAATAERSGLLSPTCISVLPDSYGNLWVGHPTGLSWLPADRYRAGSYDFIHLRHEPGQSGSLSDNFITSVREDSRGNLWVTTRGGGLHTLRLADLGGRPSFRLLFPGRVRQFNRISSVFEVEPDHYLLATDYGLRELHYESATGKVRYEGPYPTPDSTATAARKIVNDLIYGIARDGENDLWAGTYAGVSRLRREKTGLQFDNFTYTPADAGSLSNNSFRCFFLDRRERLWIGTRSGLNRVDYGDGGQAISFRKYGSAEGFRNDVIHAIQEDETGLLWLSTNRGLVSFNPEAAPGKTAVQQTFTGDGLPEASFIYRSSARGSDGRLYFGSAQGLVVFDPADLLTDSLPPRLQFTRLDILNETVRPSTGGPLRESITTAETIRLRHTDNIISLHFTALDYRAPERNRYRYRCSALGPDWIDNGGEHHVSFTNLPAGQHLLEVLGSNADGVWAEESLTLRITVVPPPWRRWWAYLIYALGVGGLCYVFYRSRLERRLAAVAAQNAVERAKLETRQAIRDRNAADFHDELGHRLTKIQLHTELASRGEAAAPVRRYLGLIQADAQGLTAGIRDLIWSLDSQQDSLFATLLRLRDFGDELFADSEVKFVATGIDASLEAVVMGAEERKHLLLLFKEAMNNSLKYAGARRAEFSCSRQGVDIHLVFLDDGRGFDPTGVKGNYGLRNMQRRAEQIGALLSISSAIGAGTQVLCVLKSREMTG